MFPSFFPDKRFLLFLPALSALISMGCVSLAEKAGQVADGSAFTEKTLATYRSAGASARRVRFKNKDGEMEEGLRIALDGFPYLEFSGSLTDAGGAFEFTGLYYLSGSYAGWNEWSAEIAGKGVFRLSGNIAYLNLRGNIEILTLASAKILHNTSKRSGEEALFSLQSRYHRINSLAETMRTLADGRHFASLKDFSAYWEPIILPEIVGAKKRPASYTMENTEWAYAEHISWNIGYTKTIFPEDLRVLRDSGALLRDWEEALAWIYCAYEWDFIEESLREAAMTAW